MPELPASVRLALWSTLALATGELRLEDAVRAATPDIAEVDGDAALARLDLWAQFGERTVLVSLPAPGDLVGLPRGGADFVGAAVEAGECVWSPLMGGALIPEVEAFGPAGDRGEIVRWTAHDCTPPPAHQVTGDTGLERELRSVVLEATGALEGLDARAWDSGLRDLADERVSTGRWALPTGIPARHSRVLTQAATVERIAATSLEHLHDAPTLASSERRSSILRSVQRESRRILAASTCAACLDLAESSGRH